MVRSGQIGRSKRPCRRLQVNPETERNIMEGLQDMIRKSNPYSEAYRSMDEVLTACERVARDLGQVTTRVTMTFTSKERLDARRYNTPTVGEVAMIFVGDDGAPPSDRDIVVHPYGDEPYRIDTTSEHTDPLTYPLLFPAGVLQVQTIQQTRSFPSLSSK